MIKDGSYPVKAGSFGCPPAGPWAVEVVGVWDKDVITWDGSVSGVYLKW